MENTPQTEQKHPPEYQQDLNPNAMAGQNIGNQSSESERGVRTAYDVKEVHRSLNDWNDDDLQQVPILPEGTRLQQGATYLDLSNRGAGEFTAMGGQTAGSGNYYVPKDEVPYPVWNRLLGVENPERL